MGLASKYLTGLDALKASFDTPSLVNEEALPVPVGRSVFSPEEERVLKLLVDGFKPEVVASTLGITPSAVSQHLAKEDFRDELARRKTLNLTKYKKIDELYDKVEMDLLTRLDQSTFLFKSPLEIASVLAKVNAAKRRLGVDQNANSTPVSQVVNITLPTVIIHKLTTTPEGHVVAIDDKSLVTIPSSAVQRLTHDPTSTQKSP